VIPIGEKNLNWIDAGGDTQIVDGVCWWGKAWVSSLMQEIAYFLEDSVHVLSTEVDFSPDSTNHRLASAGESSLSLAQVHARERIGELRD
jgi:hypothetical protein